VIWVLGGDASADGVEDVWREVARGIAIGSTGREDYSTTLMTYHPLGDQSSTRWFHDDEWLDLHMVQGGHCLRYDVRRDRPPEGYSTALDVRRDAYWAVFGGALGHTYGHHTVW
jgi:hypothetical protein